METLLNDSFFNENFYRYTLLDDKIDFLLFLILNKLKNNNTLITYCTKKYFRSFSVNLYGFLHEPNKIANKIINLLRRCYDPMYKNRCNMIITIIRLINHEPQRHKDVCDFSVGYQNIFSVQPEPPDIFLSIPGYLSCLGMILTGSVNIPANYLKSVFFNDKKKEKIIEKLLLLIIELEEIEKKLLFV